MVIVAIALALVVGLTLGLLGGGGSILTLPILRYSLGIEAHVAIASSLFIVGVTSLAGIVTHARAGRVQWATGAIFGAAGMLGAYLAGKVAGHIPAIILLSLFAVMMFATAWAMLRKKKASPAVASAPPPDPRKRYGLVLVEGLVVGAVTGLVGAGGGFLVVPALVLLGGLSMDVAIGTSLVVIAMKSMAGFAGFAEDFAIPWEVVLPMSGAAVVGSVLGGRLTSKVPPDVLRRGFAWFVVAMGFLVVGMEVPEALGAEAPLGLVLGGSLALTAALYALERALVRRDGPPSGASPEGPSVKSETRASEA